MEIEKEIGELKTSQKFILEELSALNKKIENMRIILIGNGKPEESFVFRLKKVEETQNRCPIQEIKKQTRIIIVTATITFAIAIIKYVFDFLR